MKSVWTTGAGIVAILAGSAALALLTATATGVSPVASVSAQGAFNAKDVYLDKCAVCHGQDGAGKTAKGKKSKVKDINETVGKMSEAEMLKILHDGKAPNMDAFDKAYSADQLKALVTYYRGLAKK
jgi:mono/diheme cytochrome c family protein